MIARPGAADFLADDCAIVGPSGLGRRAHLGDCTFCRVRHLVIVGVELSHREAAAVLKKQRTITKARAR
jgi:hypothetical protein